ncbi:MAG: hypothetical protein J0M34_09140 [Alphaproteobacteria bacterium]|nr:hypothetical protein [Alphaproteobacteria bacterium]
MTDDERDRIRQEIEDLEGEKGVEVRDDSVALQIASLLRYGREHDWNDDPALAEVSRLAHGPFRDPSMDEWLAKELERRAQTATAKAKAERA